MNILYRRFTQEDPLELKSNLMNFLCLFWTKRRNREREKINKLVFHALNALHSTFFCYDYKLKF